MNYLAHAYLSFNLPEILAGNMVSDFVKGRKQYDYAPMIQKGIQLHRAIDSFTDAHAATREIKKFFSPQYGLYSGPFTDIVYDFFLANDTKEFESEDSLHSFTTGIYLEMDKQLNGLPIHFQQIFPFMKEYDWLYNYRKEWGIQKSFAGLVRRAKFITDQDTVFRIFQENKTNMQPFYEDFFPLLKKHSIDTLNRLLND